ncbi:cardiolipin synthase [Vreelandella alkaliphila]|uniref:cardiolipin synthase n=1 Tax=Vreelandella alkaliphila TaxID=272774 RepID=UPI00056DE9EB|nr:cardiolipin synthase [Halomonas alkaliphila]AYF34043.1 cardiolipin synthase [Halomonas alkaliphila]
MNGISDSTVLTALSAALHLVIQWLLIIRVLLKPHRDPRARLTWIVVIIALPIVGIITYLLLGETNIGNKRAKRMREVLAQTSTPETTLGVDSTNLAPQIPAHYQHLFQVGYSISGFEPVGGNHAKVLKDSNAVIDALVADIDAAQDHVHLLFYIWLTDNNGLKVAQALIRAATRGVACRAMADDLGARAMIHSKHWRAMQAAGVQLARALPIGNPILRMLGGRIDLRNHRKIVVIDDHITYCGSQNCADPEFRVKAKYAPWVDLMIRFEGPIARQNQHLFISDWMSHVNDDIRALLHRPLPATRPGICTQVIGTGPTVRYSAMPEMFEALIYSARRSLVITTPYYVPDEPLQAALCASARRGVETLIIFPQRNDSRIVAAASRSYYAELLTAGVKIYEYVGGLLHTKSLTLDGEISLIGSANMDRRSFELNYENNILAYDSELAQQIHQRQQHYLNSSVRVDPNEVANWPRHRRLINNTVAMLGPIL